VIVSVLFVVIATPLAVALFWTYSNPVDVTVEEYVLTLTPTSQTVMKYRWANFTATLTLGGNPQAGETIYLVFVNETLTGVSAVTNSTGQALLQWNATGSASFKAGHSS